MSTQSKDNLDISYIRLRSTCDRCTVLKVRCDKKKPRCERCESVQQHCVYGPYRWKGRSTPTQAAITSSDIRTGRQVPFNGVEGFNQSTVQDIQVAERILPDGPMHSLTDLSLFPGLEPVSFDFHGELDGILPGQLEIKSLASLRGSESHHPLEAGMSESYFSSPDSSASKNACPCASSAFNILQEMYRAEATCRLERGSGLPSNDHILKINRTAAQNLDLFLSRDCTDCLEDTNIPLLIVTTMSKAISWYRAVFDRIDQYSPTKSPINLMEPLPVTPIYFGDFELDIVAEHRITAQVLLCELGYYSKILSLIRESALGRTRDGREPIGAFLGAVSHFLSTTLNDLTSKVDDFCTSKPSFTVC
ncbi:zinc finger transcription factor [Aspergillus oryzae 100-8]|uniref:Zinc finger transcription factor n=1 Tax=Aspergillus oryzae (strain 3.042) TaxID=1160506 RepID=I8A9A8_ASPO3|nr:zinc finger transcription factor [Aspergillus oryzae 3.042]KDE81687.1 zinc finger transcription factor [Aspergillus oryzae 100-8]|eukprot:EIT81857.1 zinc finger transcription factor [Aspergillus oryzae 3.042]